VLTAFTTPLALRVAPQVVELADRVLPPPLWRMINLYEDWVGRFRASEQRETPRMRRAIRTLVLEAIGFTVVLGVTTWGHAKATQFLVARADLEPRVAKGAVIGAVLVVLAPWFYAPADPRRRLAWFAGTSLVAAALAVRAWTTS
jgi:hypothetical protein